MKEDVWSTQLRRPSQATSLLVIYDARCADIRLEMVDPETFDYVTHGKSIVSWNHFDTIRPFIELVDNLQLRVDAYGQLLRLIWKTARAAVNGKSSSIDFSSLVTTSVQRISRIIRRYLHDPALNSIFSLNLRELLKQVWEFGIIFKKLELSN